MITKKYIKSRKTYRVTFELPVEQLPEGAEVESVHLVGDFNEWSGETHPMDYVKTAKAYKTRVDLPPDSIYQFRYLLNGSEWVNDWKADGYVPNEHGGENGLVQTPSA